MVNLSRQLAAGAPTFVRRLSTEVKAAAAPLQEDRLYRRLSALGRNPGMVARTINDYIREGRTIRKVELERCINELRKYKRYRDALEVRIIYARVSSAYSNSFYYSRWNSMSK